MRHVLERTFQSTRACGRGPGAPPHNFLRDSYRTAHRLERCWRGWLRGVAAEAEKTEPRMRAASASASARLHAWICLRTMHFMLI